MAEPSLAQRMEQVVRDYFRACKEVDAKAVAACFCPDAVHYFPARAPLVGADAIADGILQLVRDQGGYWTVDRVVADVAQNAAAVEWTRFFRQSDRIHRGFEFYVFEPGTVRIREIRGYYAAAFNPAMARQELVGFDYGGRGYPTLS